MVHQPYLFYVGGREYNALVDSTADEVAELKATQQAAMAKQMKLDEESLQRLAAEEEAAKVPRPACGTWQHIECPT